MPNDVDRLIAELQAERKENAKFRKDARRTSIVVRLALFWIPLIVLGVWIVRVYLPFFLNPSQ